jgi:CheB methylesterase/PAS fold
MNDPRSGRVDPGEPCDIVAIAASAGGITALGKVLGGLPADFPVPVVVVQHLDPRHKTIIADVLGRRAKLPVRLAQEGEKAVPGVVVLDSELLVRSWNSGAEELWGLRADEVRNQPFFGLDFGLPVANVGDIVHECLSTGRRAGPVQVAAINRIGRSITCVVTCSPLRAKGGGDGDGAVLLMEEVYRD